MKARQTDQMAVTVAVSAKTQKRQFLSPTTLSVLKERKKRKPGWSKNNCDNSKQMT